MKKEKLNLSNELTGEQFSKVRQFHYNLSGEDVTGSSSGRLCDSGAALVCRTTNVMKVPKNIFVAPSKRFVHFLKNA